MNLHNKIDNDTSSNNNAIKLAGETLEMLMVAVDHATDLNSIRVAVADTLQDILECLQYMSADK